MNELEARRQLRLSETDELSPAEVKRAYRAAAKLHHPDVGEQPDPEQFRLAAEAAQILAAGDRARPSAFDRIDTAIDGGRHRFTTNRSSRRVPYSSDMDDVIDAMRTSIDDIFGGVKQQEQPTVLVSRDMIRDEIRIAIDPADSVVFVIIEGGSTAFRVESAGGESIPVRFG